MSGGSDGRVKIWDLAAGTLIRELSQPAEAVWRVAFESERCVVMASRGGRTIMEVWGFAPPREYARDGAIGGGGSNSTIEGFGSGDESVEMVDAYASGGDEGLVMDD